MDHGGLLIRRVHLPGRVAIGLVRPLGDNHPRRQTAVQLAHIQRSPLDGLLEVRLSGVDTLPPCGGSGLRLKQVDDLIVKRNEGWQVFGDRLTYGHAYLATLWKWARTGLTPTFLPFS